MTQVAAASEAARAARHSNRKRIIALRGDLFSDSGYSRAIRALADVLRHYCAQLCGISLHGHASRRFNRFDHRVVTERELAELVADGFDVVHVNVTTPDHFAHVTGATNIGYFFWETDKFPRDAFWLPRLKFMDRLWAPSTWQGALMRRTTGHDDIPVVPWPQPDHPVDGAALLRALDDGLASVRVHREMSRDELANYVLRASPPGVRDDEKRIEEDEHCAGASHRFDPGLGGVVPELFARPGDTFLAIQTDAPRKGLPVLLSGWCRFKRSRAGKTAKLLIKASSLDVHADFYRTHFEFSLAVNQAKQRFGLDRPDVYFVYDRLTDLQLAALTKSSDALVSATFGEGFGGPIAEALILGVPVITPNHTSLRDLVGDDYPLAVASEPHVLALWHNLPTYSQSSTWYVPDEDSLVGRFEQFAALSKTERARLAARARRALLDHAGVGAVRRVVFQEMKRLSERP